MLNYVIRYALNHRLTILGLLIAVCGFGFISLTKLPVDVLPNLNRPTVTVLAEAHGLAPEEVEALVTVPIESVLNGAPGVLRVRSSSGIGISLAYIEFDWGTDINENRRLVSERLQLLGGRLPVGIQPVMGPVTSIMGEIQFVGLSFNESETSALDVREFADWQLRPQLLTIPGISQIVVMGGDVRQYQVLVSGTKLQKYRITLSQLKEALGELGENSTGGFLDVGDKEFLIRPTARLTSLEDISNTAIGFFQDRPVLVKDIASVKIGSQPKRGEGSINAKHAVILTVQKQPDASTIDLTKAVDDKLKEIEPLLPKGVKLEKNLFKQAHFIESAINNVEEALRDGIIMVAIILFVFLWNIRTTTITMLTIPISLLVTAIIFHLFNLGVNTMTLGGLAVAIGELVDDAIVDVENVFRRLKENKKLANPLNPLQVVYQGSLEVRSSIVISTVIVCLVFVPLFALEGIEGKLFAPLGIAYIVSILASLAVSLTITPVLCYFLLPNSKAVSHGEDGLLVKKIKSVTSKIVSASIAKPWIIFTICIVLFLGSISLIPLMGRNFLPNFNEGSATIGVAAAPGISLAASDRLGQKVEEAILSVPEVISTVRRTGRAEMDEHAEGVHWSEIDVDFKPEGGRSRPQVLAEIRERIEKTGDVYVNIGQPISHRLDHLLSGVRAQIAVKIFGPELADLRRIGGDIQSALEPIPGIVDLQIEPQVLIPQLKINVDREASSGFGIRPGALAEDLEFMLNGENVGQFIQGQRSSPIFLRLDEESRQNPDTIAATLIETSRNGKAISVGELAQVYESSGPNMVNREDMQRRLVVSANTQVRDLSSVVADIQKAIKEQVKLPDGYSIKLAGQFESEQRASKKILVLGIVALLSVFTVLFLHFRSWTISLQIMVNVPLALIGSLLAIYFTDRILSVATLIAFITLCGIASRNGILMISHYLKLLEEGNLFSKDLIIRGTLERLIPVLMTASTAGLALIPLLLAAGDPGKEILHPVAVVIVGGLVSSTLLDLIVTPTAFYLFGKKASDQYLRHKAKKGDFL